MKIYNHNKQNETFKVEEQQSLLNVVNWPQTSFCGSKTAVILDKMYI